MPVFKSLLRVAGVLVLLSAVVCLGISAFSYHRSRTFLREANRAEGTVARLIERRNNDSGPHFYPVFTFHDATGQQHEIYSSSGSFPPSHRVGDSVTLLYRSERPKEARTDGFFSLWGLSAILAGVGVFELLFGITLLLAPNFIDRFRRTSTLNNVA
jgi:hypothetical protein